MLWMHSPGNGKRSLMFYTIKVEMFPTSLLIGNLMIPLKISINIYSIRYLSVMLNVLFTISYSENPGKSV